MSSNKKPPGHIHKIREFELEKIHLADEFDILQIVGEGWFGKILLVEHRATDTEMVLKALPKPYVSLRDFYREFHYGLHLGVHKNIVTTYDVAFETAGFYVFTQEYAPLGDLTSNISESGIGELHSKRVAKQIASALDYMHSKDIVHRDVKLDNVLIYRSDFSRVKLCDFGESFRSGTIVERRNEWLPYSPPEVLDVKPEDTYKADPSHDTWQFGIVIFVCLTGCLPWQKAASDDPRYSRYLAWHATNVMIPLRRTPKLFKLLSSKASKMFRKFLEPKHDRRPKNLLDLSKFVDDRWLAKGAEKDLAENEQDELCPSMYSFHSCPEEKNKLLSTLAEHGIETTVDRNSKKARIRDWIESSVITEEDEEEDSGTGTPSSSISREPVAGHISSVKAEEAVKKIVTTIKDASNKHFDPRTGAIQQGPSAMGTIYKNPNSGARATATATADRTINGKNSSFVDTGSLITLASRNDLIKSEGQSYHSELNLNVVGVTAADHQMVNYSRPLNNMMPSSNSYNNENHQIANSQIDFKNFILLSNNNNNNMNNSSVMKTNNNHQQYLDSVVNKKSFDQFNRKYYSLLALNNNYNNNNDNGNSNSNNSNINNNFNNMQIKGSINNNSMNSMNYYKSVETISPSVSETNNKHLHYALQQNTDISQYGRNDDYIKSKSIHRSSEEATNDVSLLSSSSSSSVIKNQSIINLNNSLDSSSIHMNKNNKNNNKSNNNHPTVMSNLKGRITPIKTAAGDIDMHHQTMKDTPYDYIKLKKGSNNYLN